MTFPVWTPFFHKYHWFYDSKHIRHPLQPRCFYLADKTECFLNYIHTKFTVYTFMSVQISASTTLRQEVTPETCEGVCVRSQQHRTSPNSHHHSVSQPLHTANRHTLVPSQNSQHVRSWEAHTSTVLFTTIKVIICISYNYQTVDKKSCSLQITTDALTYSNFLHDTVIFLLSRTYATSIWPFVCLQHWLIVII